MYGKDSYCFKSTARLIAYVEAIVNLFPHNLEVYPLLSFSFQSLFVCFLLEE